MNGIFYGVVLARERHLFYVRIFKAGCMFYRTQKSEIILAL